MSVERARHVEPRGAGLAALRQQPARERGAGQADRHVDREHPLPAEPAADRAAQHPARRAAAGRGGRPDGERPRPRAPSGSVATSSASAAGATSAAPAPWIARAATSAAAVGASAQASEAAANSSSPARNARRRPHEVGHAPRQHQQPAEGQRVGAEHPLQPGRGDAEVVADGGQRDRDDRGVEDDDELRDAEQGEASVTVIHGLGGNQPALRVNSVWW